MIAIADGYFTGLQKNTAKASTAPVPYPFANDCDRIENGAHTTNLPRPPGQSPDEVNGFSMDCMSQFKLGTTSSCRTSTIAAPGGDAERESSGRMWCSIRHGELGHLVGMAVNTR